VPKFLAKRTQVVKAHMSNGQLWLDQAVLTEFLRSGEFDRHLRRTRKVYKNRRDHLIQCLKTHFSQTHIGGSDAGLHLIWRFPKGYPSATAIQAKAREHGIGIYTLSSGAATCFDADPPENILLLGYPSVSADAISFAIERLRGLIDCMQQGQEPQQETTQLEEREMRVG